MSDEGPHAQLLAALLEQTKLLRAIDLARASGYSLRRDAMEQKYIRLGNTIRRLRRDVAKADGRAA